MICNILIRLLVLAAALQGSALAQSGAKDAPEEFTKSLKRENGRFLFNGYWLTQDELKAAFDSRQTPAFSRLPHPDLSLNINIVDGQLDYWAKPEDRILSYAIDRSSMTEEQYNIVRNAMAEATSDWEKACPQCGISFPYKSSEDTAPSFEKVRFIVRYNKNDLGTGASFFPSNEKTSRVVNVTPTFFAKDNTLSHAGLLRHQLGHVLGYRHAHISPLAPPECGKEDYQSYFVGAKYDPKSVMHFLCGGGGTQEMRLSDMDIASHQLLYGFATIQVDIEGREILATASRILQSLSDQYNRLPMQTFDIKSDQGCRTYVEALGLLNELNVSPSRPGNGCASFAPLLKVENGSPRLPVLRFSGYTDVASGSFSDSNTAARAEFNALRDRVGPSNAEVSSAGSADKKLLKYSLEWQRYRANVPVSPVEAPKVWAALNKLGEIDRNISFSLDSSIGMSLETTKTPSRNSVNLQHPVTSREQICVRSDTAGPYTMLQGAQMDLRGAVPELKCDFPSQAEVACRTCGNQASCSSDACRYCSTCNRFQPRSIIVDESLDLNALNPPVASIGGSCPWKPNESKHHGTLMAQIVAGNNKFIGFNPGLRPELVIYSAATTDSKFYEDVRKVYSRETAVALISNQFCYSAQLLQEFQINTDSLCEIPGNVRAGSDDQRELLLFSRHLPTKRIKNSGDWLWVMAVGQPKGVAKVTDPPPPTTYDNSSITSPTVLADMSHIMLVSACEKCSVNRTEADQRTVWTRAHRGTGKLVPHVIAPGGIDYLENVNGEYSGGLPGFGVDNEPIRGYGTSQSAAYVSGLATKMLACYPQHYKTPGELKEAIQVTSMPVTANGSDTLVATGLVDVKAALRNPGYVYLQRTGAGDGEFERVEQGKFRWCADNFTFRQPSGVASQAVEAENVRRIVSTSNNRWVVYERRPDSQGTVDREPVFSGINSPADGQPIFTVDGQKFKLRDVLDLQLFGSAASTTCAP